jgi:hypothetical protein
MLDSPSRSGGCDVRVLFVSDTHIGLDWPARPRVVRRRRGDDFFENFERALERPQLTQSGLGSFEFRPLPARPMVARTVHFDDADPVGAHARVAAVINSTPHDAVVHLRVTGAMPAMLTAAALRAMAGARTVTLAVPRADRVSMAAGSGGR